MGTKKAEVSTIKVKFGISEGFEFGCGFFFAGFLFSVVCIPVAAVVVSIIASEAFWRLFM